MATLSSADIIDLATCEWWPREARINAGYAGHDREIVIVIAGYDGWNTTLPEIVVDALRTFLPSWKLENRGSRVEAHPTGRFAGGFTAADVETAADAVRRVCIAVVVIDARLPGKAAKAE